MPPAVSVVIPCYRQAHFLAEAIESVLAQKHPVREIVVVDDGSPDDVGEVAARYPGVGYLRQENLGPGAARNAGLARCTADLVVFLDADDRLLPDGLQIGVAALAARPECAFVWGRAHIIGADGRRAPVEPEPDPPVPSLLSLLGGNPVGPPAAVIYQRHAVESVGGYWALRALSEDWDLNLRLIRQFPGSFHGAFVAEHRRHEENMSDDYDRMLDGQLIVLQRQEALGDTDPAVRTAIRESRQHLVRVHDQERRRAALSRHTRAKRWGLALWTAALLFIQHPATIVPISASLIRKIRAAVG